MRVFIAVDLEDSVKEQLANLIENLKPAGRNIKWVARENFHLTLKFLGEIDEGQVEIVREVLIKLSHQYRPFSLKLKGTGSFPPGQNRMRVIWVGLESGPELFRLQKELEEELERKGFPKEERAFSPHLTLGRAKQPQNQEKLKKMLEKFSNREFGQMMVKEITLFQSILRPEGPVYKPLDKFELA
ncbi:MAG: RNA 2',3'-cyclic phosphodiesterase [Candidatus Aminicenantes bacterium]|nr:RNA 2',3'-cyclic phosphodiesterase [Candidatus Aminicenantes bacterium]